MVLIFGLKISHSVPNTHPNNFLPSTATSSTSNALMMVVIGSKQATLMIHSVQRWQHHLWMLPQAR